MAGIVQQCGERRNAATANLLTKKRGREGVSRPRHLPEGRNFRDSRVRVARRVRVRRGGLPAES